ncbi:glycosyltransferase family 2 protein [Alicycliphilus denitrificans]|uniref:glycosyltransferase family 2 protein n=1 Tax=Alicycliphilus denitrificans TaxID=179636 RepID=UPI0038503882
MITSIIVNFHCASMTIRAVESLLRDMPDAAIIVVDNSIDSRELAVLRARLPHPGVKILESSRNIGFGAACNLGVQRSQTDYVFLLNPDAYVVPGCLARLHACLEGSSELAAVSPMQWWDSEGQWLLPPAWLPTGPGMSTMEAAYRSGRRAWDLSMAFRKLAIQAWTNGTGHIRQRALSGGALMLRRAALPPAEELFDPAFFMYYEDSDLCLRLKQAGWALGLATDAAIVHEWINSQNKSILMEKSKKSYLDKHFRKSTQWEARMNAIIAARPPFSNPLNATTLEPGTMELEVPISLQSQWLLEVSPSPLLIPAIGHIGKGPRAQLPSILMQRLGTGPIYARLGPINGSCEGATTHVLS